MVALRIAAIARCYLAAYDADPSVRSRQRFWVRLLWSEPYTNKR